MTELATDAFRTVAPSDAVPEDSVVPYYLADRKLRISIARVDGRLYAFDDLCTCSAAPCPLSGGLLTGTTACANATAPGSTSRPAPWSTAQRSWR